MSHPIERPPQIHPQINERGNIELSQQEFDALMRWLSVFYDHVVEHLP